MHTLRSDFTPLVSLISQGKQKEEKKKEDGELLKSTRDSAKLAAEAQHGLISQVLKDIIFSRRPGKGRTDDQDAMHDAPEKGKGKDAEPLSNAVASTVGTSALVPTSTTTEGTTAQSESGTANTPGDEDVPMASS